MATRPWVSPTRRRVMERSPSWGGSPGCNFFGVGSGGNVIDGQDALRIADAAEGDGALPILGRLDGVRLFEGAGGLGNGAEEGGYLGERFGIVELAGDGEQRVIGLVVFLIKRSQFLDRHIFDIGAVADGELAVIVPGVGGFEGALGEHAVGAV